MQPAVGILRAGAVLGGLVLLAPVAVALFFILQTPAPVAFSTSAASVGLSCTGGPEGMTCEHRVAWNVALAGLALLAGGVGALSGAYRRHATSVASAGVLALTAWALLTLPSLLARAGPTEPWWMPLKVYPATLRSILELGLLVALLAAALLAAAAGMRPARAKV